MGGGESPSKGIERAGGKEGGRERAPPSPTKLAESPNSLYDVKWMKRLREATGR